MSFSTGLNGGALRRGLLWLALFAGLGLSAGCTAEGPGPAASQGFGPTVAFDTVDGPPPQVFDRLLRALQAEGTTRNISVISREARPSYRVRSYYAAEVNRGTGNATISWVWDVYGVDQQRALRLSGSEPAGKAGRDAWDAADDKVLRRISSAGLSGLATLITGGAPAQTAPQGSDQDIPVAVLPPDQGAEGSQALAFSAH